MTRIDLTDAARHREGEVVTTPTLSVLIVTYNSADIIGQCLRSLHAAMDRAASASIEVWIFDNASTDGTPELVAAQFPSVRLLSSGANLLFGPAVNHLVARSESEYVMLLNPDTIVDIDFIDPLVGVLELHPEVAISAPVVVDFAGSRQKSAQQLPRPEYEVARAIVGTKLDALLSEAWDATTVIREVEDSFSYDRPTELGFIWATCVVMRRRDAARWGPFDPAFPMYDGDVDLCERLGTEGWRGYVHTGSEVRHLGGGSSSSASKARMMTAGRYRYYRRRYGVYRSTGTRLLVNAVKALKTVI